LPFLKKKHFGTAGFRFFSPCLFFVLIFDAIRKFLKC